MYKSLFEKEWLKIRWVLLAYAIISLSVLIYIISDLHHSFEMKGAIKNWLAVIIHHKSYFSSLKYIPVIGGFAVAIFQFVPESFENRFRLSFHLPLNEIKLLLFMLVIGVTSILLVDIITILGFIFASSGFFTVEIVNASFQTMIPWFMGGIVTYLGIATVTVEPNWYQRIILALVTYFAMSLYFQGTGYKQYNHVLDVYLIPALLFTITILFPGHRLRKGAK